MNKGKRFNLGNCGCGFIVALFVLFICNSIVSTVRDQTVVVSTDLTVDYKSWVRAEKCTVGNNTVSVSASSFDLNTGVVNLIPFWPHEIAVGESKCSNIGESYSLRLSSHRANNRLWADCEVDLETWSKFPEKSRVYTRNPRSGPIDCTTLSLEEE